MGSRYKCYKDNQNCAPINYVPNHVEPFNLELNMYQYFKTIHNFLKRNEEITNFKLGSMDLVNFNIIDRIEKDRLLDINTQNDNMYNQCYTLLFYLYYIENNKERFEIEEQGIEVHNDIRILLEILQNIKRNNNTFIRSFNCKPDSKIIFFNNYNYLLRNEYQIYLKIFVILCYYSYKNLTNGKDEFELFNSLSQRVIDVEPNDGETDRINQLINLMLSNNGNNNQTVTNYKKLIIQNQYNQITNEQIQYYINSLNLSDEISNDVKTLNYLDIFSSLILLNLDGYVKGDNIQLIFNGIDIDINNILNQFKIAINNVTNDKLNDILNDILTYNTNHIFDKDQSFGNLMQKINLNYDDDDDDEYVRPSNRYSLLQESC